jgi:putative exporter of polyketide antibiotics
VRQHLGPFIWWGAGALAYAGLVAAIAKTGADLLAGSPAAAGIIATLGGSRDDLVIAFLGFGGVFTALILLVMSAVLVGALRAQEAKGYLDNLLVQPVRRTVWMIYRLLIIAVMALIISLLCGYLIWQLAANQGVSLDIAIVLQNASALVGTIILLIGIGALVYGLLPRFATIAMYTIIIWAFVVDILKAFFKLDNWVDNTSVLHYVSFAPTKAPDWTQFIWLIAIGVVLATLGVYFFSKRDVVLE